MVEITNYDDVIDSRDVIARIVVLEELESAVKQAKDILRSLDVDSEDFEDSEKQVEIEENFFGPDEEKELEDLQSLAEDASGSPDWVYGETLIRDSYFTEYAQQLAEDCGYLDQKGTNSRELQYDYFSCEFSGITYWIRS